MRSAGNYGPWSGNNPFPVDLGWSVLAALCSVIIAPSLSISVAGINVMWIALLMIAPMPWRRTHPVASAAAVHLVALLHWLSGVHVVLPADIAVLVSIYTVAAYGSQWAAIVALASGLVGSGLVTFSALLSGNFTVEIVAFSAVVGVVCVTLVVTAWALGAVRAARRERRAATSAQLDHATIERQQQERLIAGAERARIAREMHDIVAHSLSIVIAQADGGRYAAATDPQVGIRALETIAETGRAALADMRRILGVLRNETDGGDETTPQPDATDLQTLVDQLKASGMRISLVEMGQSRQLPPGAGLTLYRICQEAFTNVLKHAGPDPAVTALLTWAPTAVHLEITDDGRGAASDIKSPGHGLLGMHERAALFGGTVAAGPRPGGGFRVAATLPLPAPTAAGGGYVPGDATASYGNQRAIVSAERTEDELWKYAP